MKKQKIIVALLSAFVLSTSAFAQGRGMTLGERRKPAQDGKPAPKDLPFPLLEAPVRANPESGAAVALESTSEQFKEFVPDFVRQKLYALKGDNKEDLVFKSQGQYKQNAKVTIMQYPEREIGKNANGNKVKDSVRFLKVEYGTGFKKVKEFPLNANVSVLDLPLGYDVQLYLIYNGITHAEYVPESGGGKEFYSYRLKEFPNNYFTKDAYEQTFPPKDPNPAITVQGAISHNDFCVDYLGLKRFQKGDRIDGVVMKRTEDKKEEYYITVVNWKGKEMKRLPNEKIEPRYIYAK